MACECGYVAIMASILHVMDSVYIASVSRYAFNALPLSIPFDWSTMSLYTIKIKWKALWFSIKYHLESFVHNLCGFGCWVFGFSRVRCMFQPFYSPIFAKLNDSKNMAIWRYSAEPHYWCNYRKRANNWRYNCKLFLMTGM